MKSRRGFTALYKKVGRWYAGWVEEVPGVNTQGRTLAEARENLGEALSLVLQTNKYLTSRQTGKSKVKRESLVLTV